MTSLLVLAILDSSKTFVLEMDASNEGISAVLSQDDKPVAYLSQGLPPRAQTKSTYERELMAIVLAVQKWRHYLLGQHFIIRADQKSLRFLTDQQLMGEDQFKWSTKLVGLDFEIHYQPGRENKALDSLSRQMTFCALSLVYSSLWEQVDEEIQQDPYLSQLLSDPLQDPHSHPRYSVAKGHLYLMARLCFQRHPVLFLFCLLSSTILSWGVILVFCGHTNGWLV